MANIQLTLHASPVTAVSRGNMDVSPNEANTTDASTDRINQHSQSLFTITSSSTYDFGVARGEKVVPVVVEFDEEQIVEIEMVDGGVLYLRLDELQGLVKAEDKQEKSEINNRGAATSANNSLELSATTALGGVTGSQASRGFVSDLIKSISFPDIKWSAQFLNSSTSGVIGSLAKHFISQLETGKEGLLRWDHIRQQWLPRINPNRVIPKTEQPLLIFIHGTASSTQGSFSDLWVDEEDDFGGHQKQRWLNFVDTHYNGRVYALEHDTFRKSPARNAVDLLKMLAKEQTVHLVSHSRGGLVGELLCLSGIDGISNLGGNNKAGIKPLNEEDFKRFTSAYENQSDEEATSVLINDLEQLNKYLVFKAPKIKRFIRVACPVRGTTLASGRLDVYLSVLATTAQILAGFSNLALGIAVGVLKSVAIAAAKKRLHMSELPGLESMIPNRGLMRLLNDYPEKVDSSLTVIAGNAQADGLSRQTLWVALTNAYYWKKNDFVVESESMRGGLRRTKPVNYFLDTNNNVNHFSYFKNKDTVDLLYDALKGDNYGYSKTRSATSRTYAEARTTAITPLGITVIIPGFAGSYLLVDGEKVWLQSNHIASGKLEQLRYTTDTDDRIGVGGWVDSRYQAFSTYLEEQHRQLIISFRYDWRLSTKTNATLFSEKIQQVLALDEYESLPIKIVAHSSGGYIALKALRDSVKLRNFLINKCDLQLYLVGTPFNGTYHALELLQGVSPLIPYLAMIDSHHSKQQLTEIFSDFPGLVDMLPEAYKGANRALHKQLTSKPGYASRIHYIAGVYPRTPIGMSASGEFPTGFAGDGSARWDEIPAWIAKDRVWYLEAALHGNMLAMPNTFRALAELIMTGSSRQLPHTRPFPRTSRSLKHVKLNPEKITLLYPNDTDLENTALRASTIDTSSTETPSQCAHIRIVNGDLRFIDHPIVVGHYLQEGIKSAEEVIDKVLDGMLSELYRKNLYPGEIGTSEVVTRRGLEKQAFGAVCVGLGAIGNLNVRKLRSTLRDAFIKFGLHQRELRNNCKSVSQSQVSEAESHPVALSTLLIGAGSGGISIEDSIMSLLRALSDANTLLEEMHCQPISRLDIVELYEDITITAARALQKIKGQFEGHLTVESLIVGIRGSLKRAASVESDSWWQHLQIVADKNENLIFSPLMNRAGMDTTVHDTQTKLITSLIKQSTQETRFNRLFSQTLFSLLIPNSLKEQVLSDDGMVLLLNKRAAAYPWEMLVPNSIDGNQRPPFATEMGLIRKLHTEVDLSHPAAINHKVMIVGDPKSSFVELPGAQQEARVVNRIFMESAFKVGNNTLIRSQAVNIVARILNNPVQILHLAGHGIFVAPGDTYKGEKYPEGLAGMVLGDDIYLSEKEVRQLDTIPELVFINCCHLGKIAEKQNLPDEDKVVLGHSRSAFAANLGTAFIEAGAKCVVAAGWEVDDAAALVFATTFYERMIQYGDSFGEACKKARVDVFNKHPQTNTWGAYQCYGDPLFSFEKSTTKNPDNQEDSLPIFHSPQELIIWSKNICAGSSIEEKRQKKIIKEVRSRAEYLPETWKQDASIFEAIANVFAKVGEDIQALWWYEEASRCEDSELTLKALETKARIQTQLSEEMFDFYRQYKTMKKFDEKYLDKAITGVNNLLELGENKQRIALKAQAYRHLAQVKMDNSGASSALAQKYMTTAYELFQKKSEQIFDTSGVYDASSLLDAISIWLGLKERYYDGTFDTVINRYIRQLKRLKGQLLLSAQRANRDSYENTEALLRCELVQRLLLTRKNNTPLKFIDLQQRYLTLLDAREKQQVNQALKPIRFLHTYLDLVWPKKTQVSVKRIKDLYDQVDLISNTLDR